MEHPLKALAMKYYDNVLDLIGHTPLVKLSRMVDPGMADIYLKMEQLNPGGSVKDRMALHMVKQAEKEGRLKPGGTLVESTSGNTGLGLAMIAAVRGYRCVFTIPDKMSKEKIDMLKAFGAEVIITRADLGHDHPESYVQMAKRIANETPNALYTDQYSNMSNPEAHYLTTGPEIWDDTDGKIDCLVAGIGTGGTVSGAGKYLKEKAAEAGREVKIICPDPTGSIYRDMFYDGKARDPSMYVVEGIGHDFMVDTLDFSVIDDIRNVKDKNSFVTARRLARMEGIFVGGSSGTAVYGALQVAREMGPGKCVVVILADSGDRYLSKCFNDDWMQDMGYLGIEERLGTVRDLLQFKGNQVEFAHSDETVGSVARRMAELGMSQMPVSTGAGTAPLMMIHEADILRSLVDGRSTPDDSVAAVAKKLNGQVRLDDPLSKVQAIFDDDNVAVAIESTKVVGIVTKIDVVEFLTVRGGKLAA